mgnify:CR=1 FL=1
MKKKVTKTEERTDLRSIVIDFADNKITREQVKDMVKKEDREAFIALLMEEKSLREAQKAKADADREAEKEFLKLLSQGVAVAPPDADTALKTALARAESHPSLIQKKAGVIDLASFSLGINIWKDSLTAEEKKRISALSERLFEALNIPFNKRTIPTHLADKPVMGKSVRGSEMARAFPEVA